MYQNNKRSKLTESESAVDIPNPIRIPDHVIKHEPIEVKHEPLEIHQESIEIKHEPLPVAFGNETLFRINIEGLQGERSNTFCSCDKPLLPVDDNGWFMEDNENVRECKKFRECLECELKSRPEEKVFGTKSLLGKILTYAIHSNDGILDPKQVKKFRITKKSWNLTTTRVLKKLGETSIKLTLNEDNSLSESDIVKKKGKLLDRFIQTFTTRNEIVTSDIPFKLSLTPSFFWKENYDSLFNCLSRLGCNLLELEITYPGDGGTLPINFPNLKLPSLRKLSFQFSDADVFSDEDEDDNVEPFGNNAPGMWLLQSILNATEKLVDFRHSLSDDEIDIPQDFEFLVLPSTILNLDLNLPLSNDGLNILTRNTLPHLQYLTLMFHEIPFDHNLLYRILERVQNSLTRLDIDEDNVSYDAPCPHTFLRFPIMKKLETVVITSVECELGPGDVADLHEYLPNLKCLKPTNQTEVAFTKWIEKSTFKNVNELEVSIVNEGFADNENYFVSLDFELVKKMHAAFPNLRDLTLYFNVSNTGGLSYIFQNLTKLNTLSIFFVGNYRNYSSDLFNSVFLGLPLKTVTALREQGGRFKKVQGSNNASIRNLSELTHLSLWSPAIQDNEEGSLLTPMLFKHGFMKTELLEILNLYGKFKPTPEISKLWKKIGGKLNYYPEWDSDKCFTVGK